MATITNAAGAFGQSAVDGLAGATVREYVADAAVPVGTIVEVNVDAAGVPKVKAVAAAGNVIIGVAKTAATAADQRIQVVVDGPAYVRASTTNVATKTAFSANTSGQVTTASTTLNQTIVGRTLEATGTTADALKLVWVGVAPSAAS